MDPSRTPKKTPATFLVVLLLLLACLPTVTAVTYPAGSVVKRGDYDYVPWPSAQNGKIALCFVDLDGTGAYRANDPLFLNTAGNTCPARVAPKMIRLVATEGMTPGTETAHGDPDAFFGLQGPLDHFLRYIPRPGTASWDDRGTLYIDLNGLDASAVRIGDVRLTPFGDHPAFTPVLAGDTDLNHPLFDLASGGKSLHDDEMVYKAGSAFYINAGAKEINVAKFGVSDKDVRLNDKAIASPPAPGGVAASFPTGRPEIELTALMIEPSRPETLAPFQVTYTLQNIGDVVGSGLVTTEIGGMVVDSRGTPTLMPGENFTLVATLIAPAAPGAVFVSVNGLEVTMTVVPGELERISRSIEATTSAAALPTPSTVETVAESPLPVPFLSLLLALGAVAVMRRHRLGD